MTKTKHYYDEIIGKLQGIYDGNRKHMIEQCNERNWQELGFPDWETMLNEIETFWDEDNTIWEQWYLIWIKDCISLLESVAENK